MHDFAMVKKIEGQLVQVVPLISNACVTCTFTNCASQGRTFSVLNKRRLEIKENSIVKIEVSKFSQSIQGLVSLLFPVFCAVLGFIFSPAAAQRINTSLSENFQAICVLLFFSAACLVVFAVSRSNIHITLPEIKQVMQS